MRRSQRYSISGEEQIAEMLRRIAMDFNKRANPVFEGHRTTYPGQQPMSVLNAVGYGFMAVTPKAAYAYAAHQVLRTPSASTGIEASPYGSYHLSAGDEIYYPFKGIVDVIFK